MRQAMRLPAELSTTGGDDVLDKLERDHRHVEELFARASLGHGERRLAAVAMIIDALETHAQLEEDVVYPAIRDVVGGGDVLTDSARVEHAQIKELLGRLGAVRLEGVEEDDVVEDLRSLQLVVQAHVTIEEGEVFPAFRSVATADARAELARAMAARA